MMLPMLRTKSGNYWHKPKGKPTLETEDLQKLSLDSIDDNTDAELGDPEDMGADLDVPGSELDDDNEEMR